MIDEEAQQYADNHSRGCTLIGCEASDIEFWAYGRSSLVATDIFGICEITPIICDDIRVLIFSHFVCLELKLGNFRS